MSLETEREKFRYDILAFLRRRAWSKSQQWDKILTKPSALLKYILVGLDRYVKLYEFQLLTLNLRNWKPATRTAPQMTADFHISLPCCCGGGGSCGDGGWCRLWCRRLKSLPTVRASCAFSSLSLSLFSCAFLSFNWNVRHTLAMFFTSDFIRVHSAASSSWKRSCT